MKGWWLVLVGGRRVALWDVVFGVLVLECSMRLVSECSIFGFLDAEGLTAPGLFLEFFWMECSMAECSVDGEGLGRLRTSCCCREWGQPDRALVSGKVDVFGKKPSWRGRVAERGH